jgi:hypothetical protein
MLSGKTGLADGSKVPLFAQDVSTGDLEEQRGCLSKKRACKIATIVSLAVVGGSAVVGGFLALAYFDPAGLLAAASDILSDALNFETHEKGSISSSEPLPPSR